MEEGPSVGLKLLLIGETLACLTAEGEGGFGGLIAALVTLEALFLLKEEHPGFWRAFQISCLNLGITVVLSVATAFLSLPLPPLQSIGPALIFVIARVLSCLEVAHICAAVGVLALAKEDARTASLGGTVKKLWLVYTALAILTTVLGKLPAVRLFYRLTTVAALTALLYFLCRAMKDYR